MDYVTDRFGGSFIDGDEIRMQAQDEIGNTVVKGYRIVVPEEFP